MKVTELEPKGAYLIELEKFTFAMPVYNGMPFIKDAIDSILSQDYRNWELYILESCSNDGTAEYLKTINDPRIKILYSDTQLTIEENWARIIDIPMAEYLCIIGQDDTYLPDYLTNIVQTIRQHPACNIYRANINLMNENGEVFHQSNIKEKITMYDYLEGRLKHTYTETAAGYCFKTTRYKEIGGIDCKFRLMHTDDKLVMEAIGENNYMAVSPYHSANYRCHTGTESGSPNIEAAIGGYNYWLNWIYGLNDEKLNKIVYDYLPYHLTKIVRFFTPEEISKHKEIYTLFNINENDKYHKKIFKKLNSLKPLEYLFSVKNEYRGNIKKKIIRILGIKISFKISKSLLICKFDGIGDYIIMSQFLKNIKNSRKYKGYKLIFAGRNEFSEYAQKFDKKYVDEFIWINYPDFKNDKKYQKQCLQMFSKLKVDEIVSPVYDREPFVCEKIIKSIKHAKKIIGHKGPLNRLKLVLNDKKIAERNKKYTQFIDTGSDVIFEEERYRLFFEKLIGENIEIKKYDYELPIDLKSEFILVAPFSGAPVRTWGIYNFIKAINFITKELGYDVGILGGEIEKNKIEKIIYKTELKSKVYNLAGKVSLSELPIYLKYTKLLLTNETGTVHIARKTGTKTICISNGSYMGRFQPYNETSIRYIYPDGIEEYLSKSGEYGIEINYDINKISADEVVKEIQYMLKDDI